MSSFNPEFEELHKMTNGILLKIKQHALEMPQ